MGCHFLLQGIFPNPRIDPGSLAWQVDSLPLDEPRWKSIDNVLDDMDVDIIGISLTRNKRLYIFMLVIVHLQKQVRDPLLSIINPAQDHCKV